MQTFHNHLFECFPGPKVSASQEPPGWNISGQMKSCSSTKFRVIKLLQTYLSLEISIGCNDYLTSCLIPSNWQCLWDTCSLLRLPLVFQYPGSTLSFSSACIKALSPPICLIYRVFYLWENFISTARGMWIYITFMGTFVHLVFSWIFALRFFFSFSDSIPLLLIPPPGMAHTAKSLCLLSVYALQIFVDIYHFPPA